MPPALVSLTAALVLSALLLSALPAATSGDAPSVRVGEDRAVDLPAFAGMPLIEPHLTVDPREARHLVGAVMAVQSVDWKTRSAVTCVALASFDGGVSWRAHDLAVLECGDPWTAVLADGTAVVTVLGSVAGGEAGILVYRSPDGGRTWPRQPQVLPGAYDHETMTHDASGGSAGGTLYLVAGRMLADPAGSTLEVMRSGDGGVTFAVGSTDPSTLSYEAENPVVLADGTLVVPFEDHHTAAGTPLERRRAWVVLSRDGGRTFSEAKLIGEGCNRSRPAAFPALAVDASGGPFRDRLYWVCEADRFEGVLLYVSADRGETWSAPVRVERSRSRHPWAHSPMVAVDRDGVVAVAWYDGRNHSWHECHDLYVTVSRDGGVTFLPEAKVSTASSCPFTPRNGDAAWRYPAGGEYFGLAALPGGGFQLLWSDSRSGVYQLRTAAAGRRGDLSR
jgi:hypothetical protein